jgi:hypothetical protein
LSSERLVVGTIGYDGVGERLLREVVNRPPEEIRASSAWNCGPV